MFFGIGRDTDLEWRHRTNAAHEVGRGLITIAMRAVSLTRIGHVAAQSHNVAHAGLPVIADDVVDDLAWRADTGEMCRGSQAGLVDDPFHRGMGAVAR